MKLVHGRVELWLEPLQPGEGEALLLLHGRGGSSADFGGRPLPWAGPVHALDFSGHGRSGRMVGGTYYPELLVADADAALAELGGARVAGVGLGAYVALLLAGARSDMVPAAAMLAGDGVTGGGPAPSFGLPELAVVEQDAGVTGTLQEAPGADPYAVAAFGFDLRPPDYAVEIAEAAQRLVFCDTPPDAPPWWRATAELPTARRVDGGLDGALRALAEA